MKLIYTTALSLGFLVPSAYGAIEYNEFTLSFNKGSGAYFGSVTSQLCNVRTAEEARTLIESGAESPELLRYSCTSRGGLTPLDRAAARGHLEVVKYFVEELGANVNLCQSREVPRTALWEALLNSEFEVARYLVTQGAGTGILGAFVDSTKQTTLKDFLLQTNGDSAELNEFLTFCEDYHSLRGILNRGYEKLTQLLERGQNWLSPPTEVI